MNKIICGDCDRPLPSIGPCQTCRPFALVPPPAVDPCSSDEWYTPSWLLDAVAGATPIDLDPCSDPSRGTPAAAHYVGSEGANGLKLPWLGHVWINPPYSGIAPWLVSARYLLDAGCIDLASVLIPYRPEGYWADTIWHPASVIMHFHRRIVFEHPRGIPADGGGRFPSALVIMARTRDHLKATAHAGRVIERLPRDRARAVSCTRTLELWRREGGHNGQA